MDLEALVAPVVDAAGLDLVDVEMRREGRRRVLRVTVDRAGGLDLDTIAHVSERVSRRLDLEGFDPGPYSLEVTSPGVDRPLRRPADFAGRVGQRVRVRVEADRGRETLTGTLSAAGEEFATVATDSGEREVRYEDITSAHLVVDWDAELRKAKRSKE
ncbi:MAG TPA: ribosome maturation factor RimP [Actinomycetota bacterium]|jgi:ribosome maturation factor RimP|nr:ribosome maturation factor RimP [Actinomycetota bacterium]